MKRDLEKFRKILFYLEEHLEAGSTISSTALPFYDKGNNQEYNILIEHVRLLSESGLIEERHVPTEYNILRITAQGHDFLDALRNETVWNKTKEKMKELGSSSLGLAIKLAIEYGFDQLKN